MDAQVSSRFARFADPVRLRRGGGCRARRVGLADARRSHIHSAWHSNHHPYRDTSDMTAADLEGAALKRALKEVLVETLQEQRELFHEVFAEVLEDFALAKAIREGLET